MQFTVVSWDTFDWSHDKIQQFLRFKLSCFYSAAKTNLLTDKSFVIHMLYKTCFLCSDIWVLLYTAFQFDKVLLNK